MKNTQNSPYLFIYLGREDETHVLTMSISVEKAQFHFNISKILDILKIFNQQQQNNNNGTQTTSLTMCAFQKLIKSVTPAPTVSDFKI